MLRIDVGQTILLVACWASGCSSELGHSEQVSLRFFTYFPTNDQVVHLYRDFAEDLRKDSNGKLSVRVFTAGELPYTPFDMIKVISSNQVDLVDGSVGLLAGDLPELNVFGMPFLCVSFDEFNRAMGTTRNIFGERLSEKSNVSVLFHWAMPPQNLWTQVPLKSLEDIEGKKIRVWNQQQVEMLKKLGAIPVSIASAEVPISLQRKVVDGVITSALSVRDWRLYSFIKHGYMLNLSMGHQIVLISTDASSRLPASLRSTLENSVGEWSEKFRQRIPAMDFEARSELRAQGMILHEPSPSDLDKAHRMMSPMWEQWARRHPVSKELLAAVRKSLGK